ncbi:nucleotidyltransferase family protein, partial [Clostridiaceae bacterium UIB06]|nr:nucleotidyltransferase family protein [Clostridiaceae bacterium UIB06]
DKWTRTKMALMNGVDLVIELPLIYSLSSAEFFAFGAVSLLNNLGVINNLCFGSECGDAEILSFIGKILTKEPVEYKMILKENLDKGLSYPNARSKSLIQFLNIYDNKKLSSYNIEEILFSPNNILGIEYCKSLIKLNSSINPFSIQREGGNYNSISLDTKFSSATSIRKFIKDTKNLKYLKDHLPFNVYNILSNLQKDGYNFTFEDLLLPYIKYKSILYNNSIEQLPDVSEGIHNRIYKFLPDSKSYDQLISSVKTKRYTYTRISRILCQFFLGFESFDTASLRHNPCPYARVLGFTDAGLKILREAKPNSSIPIYNKLPKDLDEILTLDLLGTKTYSLINGSINPNSDYLISPIKAC